MAEVTGAALMEMPYATYNHDAEYETEVKPLVDALLAKCDELNLPALITIVTVQEADGNATLCQSVRMVDPQRTPIELVAARLRLEGEEDHARQLEMVGAIRQGNAAERLKSAH